MKKILVIGMGGIGSFLSREINRLILNDQINIEKVDVVVADDDVVEVKNIKYQNYNCEDIFKKKAEVIADRYGFGKIAERIKTEHQLQGYDLIVTAVDNSATRKQIIEYCYLNGTYYIDLRSEGRAIAFFTKDCEKKRVIDSLGERIDEKGTSCQLKYELDNGIIQNGNVIIATIGSQLLLNWLRNESNPKEFICRI